MKSQITFYEDIRKNPWNPNVMPSRVYAAELESILRFGFIDPVTVRENDGFEIVDGEHRWRGFGLLRETWLSGESALESYGIKVEWKDGSTHPFHESLVPLFEKNEIPISNLGTVPDADAKKLTLILNETRGRSNTVDVAALLAQIAAESGAETLGQGLPYSAPELEEHLKLANYDWNEVANTPPGNGGHGAGESEPEDVIPLSLLISPAGNGVLQEAYERAREQLAKDEMSLHENPKVALGQIIEHLAVSFLES